MRYLLIMLQIFYAFSALSQEKLGNFKLPSKIICEGVIDKQLILLEFEAEKKFKSFANARDTLPVNLSIDGKIYKETMIYPNYRLEEDLNDEGLAVLFFSAIKKENPISCLVKNCPIKDLSFKITTHDGSSAHGLLYLTIKERNQKKRQQEIELDCELR